MRNIKFRGQSKHDKSWVYGYLRRREGIDYDIIENEKGLGYDVYKESVGQYTGLHDKNEKEIFEGDLLKWGDNILEVKWGSVGWTLYSKLFRRFGQPDGGECGEINTKGYTVKSEIVGNIYERKSID